VPSYGSFSSLNKFLGWVDGWRMERSKKEEFIDLKNDFRGMLRNYII
jgi:hypothetical protein